MIRYGTLGVLSSCIVAPYTGRVLGTINTQHATQRESVSHRLPEHHSIGWAMPSQKGIVMENHRHEQTSTVEQYSGYRGSDILIAICLLAFLGMAGYGFVYAFPQFERAAIIIAWVFLVLVCVVVGYLIWHKREVDKVNLQAITDENRRKNELHELQRETIQLPADISGNYPAIYNARTQNVIVLQPGQFIQPVPNHYAPHFHYQDTSTRVSEEKPAIQAALPLPDKMLMLDVMRRWDLCPDNFFLAMGKGNQELACSISGLMHVAHDGPTDSGKTSQFYAEIIALLKLDVRVILCNPHFAPITKGGDDWRPIGQAIEAQGMIELAPNVYVPGLIRNYKSIANMLQWLSESEIDRRFTLQAQGMYTYKPIYIFVDEWPAVVRRFPEAADHQVDILQRGRAVEVDIDTNAQGFLAEDVALKGSARENFQTAFHMGGSVHSASRLLDMPVKDLNTLFKTEQVVLGKGIALLRNNASVPQAQLVRLPYANNDYCYYMLGRADNWMLPEFRNGNGVSQNQQNGNGAETRETTIEADVVSQKTTFPISQNDTLQARLNVSEETVNTIKRMKAKGKTHREISEAVGLTGRRYTNIYKPLCKELGIAIESEE